MAHSQKEKCSGKYRQGDVEGVGGEELDDRPVLPQERDVSQDFIEEEEEKVVEETKRGKEYLHPVDDVLCGPFGEGFLQLTHRRLARRGLLLSKRRY